MKKVQLISILILTVLLANFCIAENTTNMPANTTKATNTSNPITNFMQKEISSPSFKFIGAPAQLIYQNLIIYLLFILIAYIIIADILNSINLFDKKWISRAIGLIIILVGVYSSKMYEFLIFATTMGFANMFASATKQYIILGILGAYLIARVLIKILRNSDIINKEKIEAEADRLRTLRKVQDIEAKAEGI
jgi:hypothetical protein